MTEFEARSTHLKETNENTLLGLKKANLYSPHVLSKVSVIFISLSLALFFSFIVSIRSH